MLCIYNENTIPYYNLASEEYLLKNSKEEYFMLWRNSPCIVIGKNQNTLSEINKEYVDENNIKVVRRLSGGGAVFHDLGNINFTFISNEKNSFQDFKRFTYPIIKALNSLEINASFTGRNDLTIDDKKFSGNAQYCYRDRILHHGTLLYSANVNNLSSALNVNRKKFRDKSVKSVVSRVTNISSHMKNPMAIEDFILYLMKEVINDLVNSKLYSFSKEEDESIKKLALDKYSTWEWNFGFSPKFSYTNEFKYLGGLIEFNCNIDKGIIREPKFFGDFFGRHDISEIESAIEGSLYKEEAVLNILKSFDLNDYFYNISLEEIIKLIF